MVTGIYKFTNKLDKKVYIGQAVNIERRRKAHFDIAKKHKDNTYFHNALNKYGIDNFDFEVLIECPKENLNYWEQFYISYYCSNNKRFGYNETEGGYSTCFSEDVLYRMSESAKKRGNNLPEGFKHSVESRKKNSDSHKGKTPWNKGIKTGPNPKISEAKRGKEGPNKGRKFSSEAKKHMSESHIGKKSGNTGKHKVWDDDNHTKYHFE